MASSMTDGQVERWADGDDARWVQRAMAKVIVTLDLHYIYGFGDARNLKDIAQPRRQVGVVAQLRLVAFEMLVVDQIESHESSKHSNVGFGYLRPYQIPAAFEPKF